MPDTAPLAESLRRALNMVEGRSVDYVPPAPTSETHRGSYSQVDQQFDAVGFSFHPADAVRHGYLQTGDRSDLVALNSRGGKARDAQMWGN